MKFLLNYLELVLSAVGVVVILALPVIMGVPHGDVWQVTAQAAIAIGAIHGIIFWVVRARQRRVRHHTLHEARVMLRDGIHRQVAALLTMDADASPEQRKRLDGVFDSLVLLDHLLDTLDEQRMTAWSISREGQAELQKPIRRAGQAPALPDLNITRHSRN